MVGMVRFSCETLKRRAAYSGVAFRSDFRLLYTVLAGAARRVKPGPHYFAFRK